ncbi:MAG: glutaminase, partial [Mycobacterium sp.]|nr:glutaminase [Mycobacterium sp.]
ELHGDLLFAGAEQVLRRVEREKGDFDVAILDVTRVDTINDAARSLLAGMRGTLSSVGKEGFLVDPENAVARAEKQDDFDVVVFGALNDAVAAAEDLQARL